VRPLVVLIICLRGVVAAGQSVPSLDRIGDLEIPDVSQLTRVDRETRPGRDERKSSSFVLRTRPHPVDGDRYVIVTDHTESGYLDALKRLARARDGIIVRVDDLAVLHQHEDRVTRLQAQLRKARVRFLAIAPRKESFRENMLLGMWELTSTLDDDPQLDVLPGVLLASNVRSFSSLIGRSIAHRPTPRAGLRPMAISQVPSARELRSLQKAAVLRKMFARSGLETPIVAVYGRRATEAAKLVGGDIWNLQATKEQRFVKSFPEPAAAALKKCSLLVMHGHGTPGMSCGVDIEGLPGDLSGKVILSGSCFSASPARSDLPAMRQAPGGYRVEQRDAFALRAIDNGASVFFGHMRLSMGFPHLFPVLESWLEGGTVGESYQRLINALVVLQGFGPGRFVVPPDWPAGRRLRQNALLYVVFGDPAMRPLAAPAGKREAGPESCRASSVTGPVLAGSGVAGDHVSR